MLPVQLSWFFGLNLNGCIQIRSNFLFPLLFFLWWFFGSNLNGCINNFVHNVISDFCIQLQIYFISFVYDLYIQLEGSGFCCKLKILL
jgi:hypothetical protein